MNQVIRQRGAGMSSYFFPDHHHPYSNNTFKIAYRWIQENTLLVSIIASFTYLIPMIVFPQFRILEDSVFEESVKSVHNTIVLSCTLASVFPLLVDLSLDIISFRKIEFLSYRFLSLFTIIVSSVIILIMQKTSYAATISLTLSSWGYFVEISVVLCFLNHLIPHIFSVSRVYFMLFGYYFCFMTVIMNVIPTNSLVLTIFHYILYASFGLLFLVYFFLFFYELWEKYIDPNNKDFYSWMNQLSMKEECAIVFITGLSVGFIAYILVLVYFDLRVAEVIYMNEPSTFIIELGRTFVCIFTYVMPARLFREKIVVEKSNLETKTDFIKYISHEVRTPLAAVDMGLSLMIADAEEGKDIDKYLLKSRAVDLKEAAQSIKDIMNDLQLYERLESNTLTLNLTEESPFLLVDRIVASYGRDFIVTPFEEDIPFYRNLKIFVDKTKFKLIIDGLLSPALRSSKTDGVVEVSFDLIYPHRRQGLRYSVTPEETVENSIVINILDTRSGLTPQTFNAMNISHLKLERVAHDDGRETVFALWLAFKLLEAHSSAVAIQADATGLGIQFRFELRLTWTASLSSTNSAMIVAQDIEVDTGAIRTEEQMTPAVDISSISIRLTVLCIDDSSLIRKLMSQFIRGLGHIYYEADDGDKGVVLFNELRHRGINIDVILMDFQMPMMTGPVATAIIRNDFNYDGVILGVTGNLLESDVNDFLAAGADAIIEKPITAEAFYSNYQLAISSTNLRRASV